MKPSIRMLCLGVLLSCAPEESGWIGRQASAEDTGSGPAPLIVEGMLQTDCTDGIDNDGDQQIDCVDPGCAADTACFEGGEPAVLDLEVSLRGRIQDVITRSAPNTEHCLDVFNVFPVLVDGAIELLASGRSEPDGSWDIEGVRIVGHGGIIVLAYDCDEGANTIYPSATRIPVEDLSSLESGQRLTHIRLYALGRMHEATLDSALAEHGSQIDESGAVIAVVLEGEGTRVADATVDCIDGFCPSFYLSNATDAEISIYEGDGTLRTSTTANGLVVIPGAEGSTYQAHATDRNFHGQTLFALPEMVIFAPFYAQ